MIKCAESGAAAPGGSAGSSAAAKALPYQATGRASGAARRWRTNAIPPARSGTSAGTWLSGVASVVLVRGRGCGSGCGDLDRDWALDRGRLAQSPPSAATIAATLGKLMDVALTRARRL
jgi:hypothetical protein